jgi:hypothetical protein
MGEGESREEIAAVESGVSPCNGRAAVAFPSDHPNNSCQARQHQADRAGSGVSSGALAVRKNESGIAIFVHCGSKVKAPTPVRGCGHPKLDEAVFFSPSTSTAIEISRHCRGTPGASTAPNQTCACICAAASHSSVNGSVFPGPLN